MRFLVLCVVAVSLLVPAVVSQPRPPSAPSAQKRCCPDRPLRSLLLRTCNSDDNCNTDRRELCCNGGCVPYNRQERRCCCPAMRRHRLCSLLTLDRTDINCSNGYKWCPRPFCNSRRCMRAEPCVYVTPPTPSIATTTTERPPLPDPPTGCCPRDDVFKDLVSSGIISEPCETHADCSGQGDLCCHGICVPSYYHHQNCCCLAITTMQCPAEGCRDNTECNSPQICCKSDNRCPLGNCVDPVPCPCEGEGHCNCYDDPHCNTFDRRSFDFHGTCEYGFTRDGCVSGLPVYQNNFHVIIDQELPHASAHYATIVGVTVDFPVLGIKVKLTMDGVVTVTGGTLPTSITANPWILEAPVFGLNSVVLTERWHKVDVKVACWMKERVCGLCANYNDFPSDDLILGPELSLCDFPAGTTTGQLTVDQNVYGMSWQVPLEDNCTCEIPTRSPARPRMRTVPVCSRVFDHAMFANCGEFAAELLGNCQFDVSNSPQDGDRTCLYAGLLVDACSPNPDIPDDWAKTFCHSS